MYVETAPVRCLVCELPTLREREIPLFLGEVGSGTEQNVGEGRTFGKDGS